MLSKSAGITAMHIEAAIFPPNTTMCQLLCASTQRATRASLFIHGDVQTPALKSYF